MADEKLASAEELAKSFNVSQGAIYKLAKSGALPSIRIGTSVRFDPMDVRRYVQSHKRGGKESGPSLVALPRRKGR